MKSPFSGDESARHKKKKNLVTKCTDHKKYLFPSLQFSIAKTEAVLPGIRKIQGSLRKFSPSLRWVRWAAAFLWEMEGVCLMMDTKWTGC